MAAAKICLIVNLFLLHAADMFDPTTHKNWKSLNLEECGKIYENRIIGGSDAKLGEFPWIARIGYFMNKSEKISYRCGGALVTHATIVTAAHCITNIPPEVKLAAVSLGELDERADPDCEGDLCSHLIVIPIKEAIAHSGFIKAGLVNDIAIVRLQTEVPFSNFVKPICLMHGPKLEKNWEGSTATVAGWGVTDMRTKSLHHFLQKITLPVREQGMCGDVFKRYFRMRSSQMCVGGYKEKDSCGGDSGGPLMIIDKMYEHEYPRMYFLGLVSFGMAKCGSDGWPGVYTRIPYYMEWIMENLLENKKNFTVFKPVKIGV